VGVADTCDRQGARGTRRPAFPTPDAGAFVSGYPAIPNRDWLKSSAIFRQLPALRKRVSELERRLANLEHPKK
jgi:UDP-3-O-[3-hydroxymyristoyl] glucosamine N-acyltransferase